MGLKTAVALSGGIDSLVAAFQLKQKGNDVLGLHFLTGYENPALVSAMDDIGEQLSIPINIVDLRRQFREKVVAYFIQTYRQGRTPNPCLVCNAVIKFGSLLEHARSMGAERLATGHYAQVHSDAQGRMHLLKGTDTRKDQSYFLSFLSREQLGAACFPLGDTDKSSVKRIAKAAGLHPVTAQESQDVCFIRDGIYADFLKQHGLVSEPGPIVDLQGNVLGHHNGLHLFTIGQRRGINCPADTPYYVLALDVHHNRLVVGPRNELNVKTFETTHVHWLQAPPVSTETFRTKIRYHHQATPAQVTPMGHDRVSVRFEHAQQAVTPGQGAVFYRDNEVFGAGWIATPHPAK